MPHTTAALASSEVEMSAAPAIIPFPHTDAALPVPTYLEETYWWAYVRPWAVKFFEREWLVNLILWGNYHRLRDAALAAMGDSLTGATLQISCCYGNLTPLLAAKAQNSGGSLDVVDVLPVQLNNLRRKLPVGSSVRTTVMDSTNLQLPDGVYDRALLFFLMHEQPADIRARTLAEAFRVVKPGGTVTIVDFSRPRLWHPLRWTWLPVLSVLEPFAPDMWKNELSRWLPKSLCVQPARIYKRLFGDMYRLEQYERK